MDKREILIQHVSRFVKLTDEQAVFKDLGDTLIYNDFTLNIRLAAGKAA